MFFINEGYNLEPKEESFFDKYSFLDILPKNTKLSSIIDAKP
jgi:hypothetical protein